MMSISPQFGHGVRLAKKLLPSIQNAGHRPCVLDTLMRDSTRPYWKSNLPYVLIRPEVYWQVVLPLIGSGGHAEPGVGCLRTWITRLPAPSILALSLLV